MNVCGMRDGMSGNILGQISTIYYRLFYIKQVPVTLFYIDATFLHKIDINKFIFTNAVDQENVDNDAENINPPPNMMQEYAMRSHIAQTAFPA